MARAALLWDNRKAFPGKVLIEGDSFCDPPIVKVRGEKNVDLDGR